MQKVGIWIVVPNHLKKFIDKNSSNTLNISIWAFLPHLHLCLFWALQAIILSKRIKFLRRNIFWGKPRPANDHAERPAGRPWLWSLLVSKKCLKRIIPALFTCDLWSDLWWSIWKYLFILDGIIEHTGYSRHCLGGVTLPPMNTVPEFSCSLKFLSLCGIPELRSTWLKWSVPKNLKMKGGRHLDATLILVVEISWWCCAEHECYWSNLSWQRCWPLFSLGPPFLQWIESSIVFEGMSVEAQFLSKIRMVFHIIGILASPFYVTVFEASPYFLGFP